MSGSERGKWLVLAVVGAAFFMTILDVAIVNVAIPSIQKDLHIAESTVQWVITAYAITFGGFLLLGGRMADLLGRKRIFIVGLVLFTIASLVCGLANNIGVLIGARAVQGIGAAIISPAALSIVTTTFEEGAERNKALGIWGALGGSGAAAGVLFGGILTKYLGWEWIFFVNVPVGALVFALTWPFVPESRVELGHRRFDAAGAMTVTGGLALLVLAASLGWYTQIPVGGHYWPDLLPAYITFALGLAFSFIPVSIAALAQVEPHEAGLASGLINTNQQIGGAIGVAVAATIFTSYARPRHLTPAALTTGYEHAFWALLAVALVGAIAAAVLLPGERLQPAVEVEAAAG